MSREEEQLLCDALVNLGPVETEQGLQAEGVRKIQEVLHCTLADARTTLGALSVRRPGCNAGPLGFCGRPQLAGPAQSPPDQDSRERHRGVAPPPATSANYTMPRNTSSGADHFRAVATMMRDVTFPPVTTHHNTSIQRKRFAAVQGSSRSPLMKKGSMSLYSRIFTVVPLGAFPCAIARACSDCATIARGRSFLWIE